jgi:hypothetical protein
VFDKATEAASVETMKKSVEAIDKELAALVEASTPADDPKVARLEAEKSRLLERIEAEQKRLWESEGSD